MLGVILNMVPPTSGISSAYGHSGRYAYSPADKAGGWPPPCAASAAEPCWRTSIEAELTRGAAMSGHEREAVSPGRTG
jgi:hypothetical protein